MWARRVDLYTRLSVATDAEGRGAAWGLRTQETKAIETRDGDMQATLLSVDAP